MTDPEGTLVPSGRSDRQNAMPNYLNLNESAFGRDGFTVAQVPDTVKPKLVAGKWWLVGGECWLAEFKVECSALRVEC